MKKDFSRDPMKSKTGKVHLGPLNLDQLDKLLEGARKKNKPMILRRISLLESRGSVRSADKQGVSNDS
jgi:hypothetical protein